MIENAYNKTENILIHGIELPEAASLLDILCRFKFQYFCALTKQHSLQSLVLTRSPYALDLPNQSKKLKPSLCTLDSSIALGHSKVILILLHLRP